MAGGLARRLAGTLVALGAIAAFPGAASAAAPGCSLAPTGGTIERAFAGRSYRIHVPAGISAAEAPLLVSLHGFGANNDNHETLTRWTPFAAARRFIVAYPQGNTSDGSGAWNWHTPDSPDTRFLRGLVGEISARWCVDARRVHFDGWSNGGIMSQRMACDAADLVASATSYAGVSTTLGGLGMPCAPSCPIAVGLLAGQLDPVWLGLAQNAAEWRALDGCAATPARTTDAHGTSDLYACAGGTHVLAGTVALASHNWPGGPKGEDQRARMWAFLSAHPKP